MFDVGKIRKDFPMLMNHEDTKNPSIYFDNAATTYKPQAVIDAVMSYYTKKSVNIHRGDYDLSYQVSSEYESARATIAKFINAEARELVFTSGASASLNLVAYGWGRKYLKPGDVVLSTEAEHASNILPWFKTVEETQAILEFIPLTKDGKLTVENFKKVMNEKVKVVTIASVTNVLGYIVPIKEIVDISHEYGAIVVVDGAQSVPHIATDVKALDIDFLAFSAHKMVGPTGVGALYGKFELLQQTDPFILGGGSNARFDICGNILLKNPPYKFEAGTPAIEAVLGFEAAVKYLDQIGMDHIHKYEQDLKNYLVEQLKTMEHIELYNPDTDTGIITFNAKGIFAQDAASYINANHVFVRAGNHCAKILMELLQTSETIRASLYFYNTKEEVDHFIEVVRGITLEKCIDLYV